MKIKQKQEILSLDRIIENSWIKEWDWINDWARWKYREDRIRFVEWESHINPESIYFKINWWWQRWFVCWHIDEIIRLNKLLKAKERYDLHMTMWIQDIKEWLLFLSELREDWFDREAKIIWNKLKKNDNNSTT